LAPLEASRRTERSHGVAPATEPFEGNAEIAVRHGIPRVGPDRRFVIVDRIEHVIVFEQHVPDVDECRGTFCIAIESERKSLEGFVAANERDQHHAALVMRRGFVPSFGRFAPGRFEFVQRLFVTSRVERHDAALEGVSGTWAAP